MRRILWIIVAVVVIVPLGGALYWALACPCGRVPGLYLRGTEVAEPVTDWTFANRVPLCQIQVDTGLLSQANNLNCMATEGGKLYLSCANCAGKRWSNAAVRNAEAWLRLDRNVYPVTLARVLDQDDRERAWDARALKMHTLQNPGSPMPPDEDTSPSDDWWTFEVVSR